jgi:hypothetical protein
VASGKIEARLVAALRKDLLDPGVIATAVEAYRLERQRLSREAANIRASLEREQPESRRKIKWLIGGIENGRGSAHVSDRLYELEAREQVVKSQLALANGPDVSSSIFRRPRRISRWLCSRRPQDCSPPPDR